MSRSRNLGLVCLAAAALVLPTLYVEATADDAVLRLPEGDVTVATIVERGSVRRADDATSRGGVVFTDDLILIAPDTQRLTAVDRDTFEKAWSLDLRLDRDDDTGACPLQPPPEDATAITVFSGLHCGRLDTYDLATGKHLATEKVELGLSVLATAGITHLGDTTYWVDPDDNFFRIEADGSSTAVGRASALGLTEDDNVSGIAGIAGSDVLVAKVDQSFDLGEDAPDDLFGTDQGYFLGLRADDQGQLQEVWRRPIRKAIGKGVVRDTTTFRDQMEGVVVNLLRGSRLPRLAQFDPESGDLLDTLLELRRNPPGGFPKWIEYSSGTVDTKVEGDQVISTASNRQNDQGVARYDLAKGRIVWSWMPTFREDPLTASGAQPLGISVDGGAYYVAGMAYDEYVLAELDFETGKELRTWRLPARLGRKITDGHAFLDGNDLVVLPAYTSTFDKAGAFVVEIGRRAPLWWASPSGWKEAGLLSD